MDTATSTLLIGIGATALTDAWAWLRHRWLGLPLPDFAMLGRWIGHMPRGRFVHSAIAAAAPVRGERALGWFAHYAIGITFAVLLIALMGPEWLRQPTPVPALLVGIATVAAPFLLLQPGVGLGLAARRAPRPNLARIHSLITHAVFGAGLYLAALALRIPATL